MKRSVISIVLFALLAAAAATLCTGCDLVRASLGKPTSADLELLRLAERVRAESALKDSLANKEMAAPAPATPAEAPAPADTAKPAVQEEPIPAPTVLQAIEPKAAEALVEEGIKKYYVVVGAFKEESGIDYYVKELENKGFKAVLLPFKSGSTAVCVEGTDDLETARAQMKTLRAAGIDAWLYSSKQNLHKTK